MEAFWNKSNLNRPPTITWRPSQGEFDTSNFMGDINKALKDLLSQHTLQSDAAVLSRLIYRMKWKFRNDKGLKNMEKVNRALLNYLHLSLEKEFNYLRENTVLTKDGDASLPSRQMLQFVLVRTQSFAKLMCRIENVALDAAKYFKSRINRGQAWTMSVIAYSIIARIWMLSRHFVLRCCDWYNNLYVYHEKLKQFGVSWLPNNYSLPSDLKTWLSITWIEQDIKSPTEEELSSKILSLIKSEDETESDFIKVEKKKKIKNKKVFKNEIKSSQVNENPFSTLDLGQKISRESFISKVEKKKPTKSLKKKSNIDLNCIKTKKDLTNLLILDSYPGLDKLQWNMIKKKVSKTIAQLNKCPSDNIKSKLLIDKAIEFLRTCVN